MILLILYFSLVDEIFLAGSYLSCFLLIDLLWEFHSRHYFIGFVSYFRFCSSHENAGMVVDMGFISCMVLPSGVLHFWMVIEIMIYCVETTVIIAMVDLEDLYPLLRAMLKLSYLSFYCMWMPSSSEEPKINITWPI
jgi:hypothetical protein